MINNKSIIFILTIISLAAVFLFWSGESARYPTGGTNIVVFGDSIAAGVGASAGKDITGRLTTSLNTEVINLGVSGDTTGEALLRIEKLIETDPKIAVIIVGGNDAIRKLPIEETFLNLEKIIVRLEEHGTAVVLVGEPGGLYGNRYEKEYERLAKKHRTFYVSNILSGLIGRTQYMSDYIHPNDQGYEIVTERILLVLQDILAGE